MKKLHDPEVSRAIRARVQRLSPDAVRRWGKMSVDQMLWHVNETMRAALGQTTPPPDKRPIPHSLLRLLVLAAPWPKGAPTHPSFVCGERYDFEEQRALCLRLMETFVARDIEAPWPVSPTFGRVKGRFMSRLHAKHLDHHLKQFSA
jgi:hypothetical protein